MLTQKIVVEPNGETIVIIERWLHMNIFHLIGKRYLESKGFRVYLVSHILSKGSFESSAQRLKDFIDSKQLRDFTLVGVSSGGISALLYLEKLDGWSNVKNFVSVATPFGGTVFALPIAIIKPCREILPWNKTIKKIQSTLLKHPEKMLCIVALVDEFVPRKSATLQNVKTKEIDVIGHNALHLTNTETYKTISEVAL
jgi:pimeloyl-ACP methyl ester carboxylesterase